MGGAHFNLVLRREGEPAAKQLQKRFDTPYLLSRPYGIEGTLKWIKEVEQASGLTANRIFLETEREKTRVQVEIDGGSLPGTSLSLGGYADVVRGILSFGCGELGFRKGTCWCDSPDMGTDDFPCFSEDQWMHLVRSHRNGILMASGEALDWAGHSPELRISNPGTKWHRHTSWMPPFMGFRGAIHLVYLWANNVTAYR
jgi:hypothetical protein